MTAREMQIAFERLVQTANPEYIINNKLDSDTIFYFLNAAQEKFIKLNYISLDNLKNTVEPFNKNTDAFRTLITTKYIGTSAGSDSEINCTNFRLPSDYFLYLRSYSKVDGTYLNISEPKVVTNKLINNNELENIISTYYNSLILRNPYCIIQSQIGDLGPSAGLAIYADKYTTVYDCSVTYIRRPKSFNVIESPEVLNKCELSETVHQEVVELAVEMFLTTGSYKSSNNTNKQKDTNQS